MYSPVTAVLKYCDVLDFAELSVLELGIHQKRIDRIRDNPAQARRELDEHDQEHPDDFLSLLLS
jgi:hypothetical protein